MNIALFSTNQLVFYGTKYSKMDTLKFFKGCLPLVSLGPFLNTLSHIRKNIFACLFSVHNTISLSRHEQVCLMRLSEINIVTKHL